MIIAFDRQDSEKVTKNYRDKSPKIQIVSMMWFLTFQWVTKE